MTRLLTVEQSAEYMNTSVRFVRRLVAERRIPFVKLGKFVRISTADIEALISANRVEPMTSVGVKARRRRVA